MHTIDVDFEVFKQLTVRRATEEVTYNDVIRELLGLGQATSSSIKKPSGPSPEDWVVKGVTFPVGTEFRANFKGKLYTAIVKGGSLVLDGHPYDSPSAAAMAITKGSVNGWIFWECRIPGKATWTLISNLRR